MHDPISSALSLQCTVALLTDFPKAIFSSYTLAATLNKPGCTKIYYILTFIVLLNKKNISIIYIGIQSTHYFFSATLKKKIYKIPHPLKKMVESKSKSVLL